MLCVCQTLASRASEDALREYAAISTQLSLESHKWDGTVVWAVWVLKAELKPFGSFSPFKLVLSDQAVTEQIDR